ncbi:hypothetical protein GBA52_028243 [Prunus armeniaca]|nr:hypothetical protein GBA52_028243 [Prunus armeniaca]
MKDNYGGECENFSDLNYCSFECENLNYCIQITISSWITRDINRIEFLRYLGHMRCLLGWIGSQTLDSDAQLLLLLLAHKVGLGSLNSFCGRSCLFRFSSLGKKKKKGEGRGL